MDILGPSTVTKEAAQRWAASRSCTAEFFALAEIFWRLSPLVGVRPEVAYAQAAHETGYGHFGRAVTPEHRNTCGLKVRDPGADDAADSHARFPTWEVGVQAHLDHLALYAGAPGYPRQDTPDPRHFGWIAGKAPTVEELGGKWAPSAEYGKRLVEKVRHMEALS